MNIPPPRETDIEKEAERLMLSLYMPASILVNKDLQILRFYGATFSYLQPASGKASLHLLKMIREELIFELRSLIKQVKKDGKSARKEKLQLTENDLPRLRPNARPITGRTRKTGGSPPWTKSCGMPANMSNPLRKTSKLPGKNCSRPMKRCCPPTKSCRVSMKNWRRRKKNCSPLMKS
jgi:hypothetical protein